MKFQASLRRHSSILQKKLFSLFKGPWLQKKVNKSYCYCFCMLSRVALHLCFNENTSNSFSNYRASTKNLYALKADTDVSLTVIFVYITGVDPGFLERGFICIKVWGLALLILSHFHSETKLFHFHRIFKNRGQEVGFKRTTSGSTTALYMWANEGGLRPQLLMEH